MVQRTSLLWLAVLSAVMPACYLSHGIEPAAVDATTPRPDAGVTMPDASRPTSCEVRVERCRPVREAPLRLFDAQSQSPEIVWGPERLLLTFWAPGESGAGAPILQHLDLDGRILDEMRLARGYNTTHLTWNPRIGAGLVSAESMLTWIDGDGRPAEEAWLSADPRFRGTIDVGPTEDGFAVVVGRTSLETQLGITTVAGEVSWRGSGIFVGEPAVADRWDGELVALSGGFLVRHDGTRWSEPAELLAGDAFVPVDAVLLEGSIYTLHGHYDGRDVVRRWTLDAELLAEAQVGEPSGSGSSRLFVVGGRLLVVSTRLAPDAPIVLAELELRSLEPAAELLQIAEPVAGIYNRHSIAMTETPRGLAFVWTEGPIGSGNMRPWLRLYECCVD